ncbi:polysaccharide biosynthesis protein [Cellulomonas sp. Root930]|nr:polysaccharide biosynthesis protein [Cellulomonas sp. Root930]
MTEPGQPVSEVQVDEPRPAGRRPAHALVWSFANTAASRLGTLAIGIVLARLLGPEEFGTYAVAYIALIAVLSFNELGVSLAIVRWPDDPRAIAPTVTTISVVTSTLIALGVMLVAPAFASQMGDPGATGLVQLLALCVIINGIVASPAALLQRHFRQDRRMVIDQVNVWLGAGVSVALALAGVGALSLVVGRLAGAIVSGVLFLAYSPERFRFGFDRQYVRPLLAFGLPLAGASVIVFAAGYVDQLVVGRVLGSVALGAYVLAFNLASWPVSMFSQPLRSVAPALFARLQGDGAVMGETFARVVRPLAAVALPACAVLAAAAPEVVQFVYGAAWLPAAEPLRWLAIVAAGRILVELAYDYLVVQGRSHALLLVQALWFAALLPAVVVGAQQGGLGGAGLAQVVVVGVVVLPVYLWLLARAAVRPGEVLRRLAVPVAASLVLAGLVVVVLAAVGSPLLGLLIAGALTAGVAALLLHGARSDIALLRTTSDAVV